MKSDCDRLEPLGGGFFAAVNDGCRLGDDPFLLAGFAAVRPGDVCADLGTGSGILALVLLKNGARTALGLDNSPDAVRLARLSAAASHVDDRFAVALTDLADRAALPGAAFTLAVANPPWFLGGRPCADARRDAARHAAPDTPAVFCRAAARLLRPDGRFCLCFPPDSLAAYTAALADAGLFPGRLQAVLHSAGKPARLLLCEAFADTKANGGQTGFRSLPPFVCRDPDGQSTAEYKALFGDFYPVSLQLVQ